MNRRGNFQVQLSACMPCNLQGVPVLKVHIYIFEFQKKGVKNYIKKNV